jgi:hypothetical protein
MLCGAEMVNTEDIDLLPVDYLPLNYLIWRFQIKELGSVYNKQQRLA